MRSRKEERHDPLEEPILVWERIDKMDDLSFGQFMQRVENRLDAGKTIYNDRSFEEDPLELIQQIREEVQDICGWSYILDRRLERIIEVSSRVLSMLHDSLKP